MRASCVIIVVAVAACGEQRSTPPPQQPYYYGGQQSGGGAPPSSVPPASSGSPGCNKPARTGVHANQRIPIFGKQRSYTLVVPDSYQATTAYPIVFGLHGNGGNGAGIRAQLDLERVAQGKAIFVYPDAIGGGWDLDNAAGKNGDVGLFDGILAVVQSSFCVDLQRVFIAGFSNGAYMANQLACRRGSRVRAVATFAGGGPYENHGSYDESGHLVCPEKSVASLVVHGLADSAVAPSEGQKSIDHWTFANRCSGSTGIQPAGCVAFSGCMQPVLACKVQGLGHTVWAQGKTLAWSFFDAQR